MIEQQTALLTHERLVTAAPDQRARLVEEFLLDTVRVLRPASAAPIDGTVRLAEVGIDSLQVVELKFELDQVLGIEADIELIIDNPTIAELAANGVRGAGL
ncbi:MAG: acyl carrier protein [Caulobacter sp.]